MMSEEVKEEKNPSLIDSIKEAAHSYHVNKSEETDFPAEKTFETRVSKTSNKRAKSIAEKLGFINFDEELLDPPSFTRKKVEPEKASRET